MGWIVLLWVWVVSGQALGAPPSGHGARLVPQVGHDNAVSSVGFSPDGTIVLSSSQIDETTALWHADTGILTLALEGSATMPGAFSPDGGQVVTALGQVALIWDAQTGRTLHRLEGHTKSVFSAAFSPDGTQIVTRSDDGTVVLWSAATGELVHRLGGDEWFLWSAQFSPDGQQVWTTGGSLSTWDVRTGELVRRVEEFPIATGFVFAPDGSRFVSPTAYDVPDFVIRDTRTWEVRRALNATDVGVVAFAPDGKQLVAGLGSGEGLVFDVRSGRQVRRLQGHTGRITSTAYSPDGKQIVTTSDDQAAIVWDARTGTAFHRLQGHPGSVHQAVFSPDGTRLVTAGDGFAALTWDVATGAPLHVLESRAYLVASAAVSADGARIVTGSWDAASVWDTAAGGVVQRLGGRAAWVTQVALSPDGRWIVTADQGVAHVVDAATFEDRHALRGHSDPITGLAFSPDGARLLTISEDSIAVLWDPITGNAVHRLNGHQAAVRAAAFSADRTRLVTGSDDGTAIVWDVATGARRQTLQAHFAGVSAVAFSPDGSQVLTGSADSTAMLWSAATGKPIQLFEGHKGGVLSVSFSPDGRHVLTTSADGRVGLWDPQRGTLLAMLEGHQGPVLAAAWFPDGARVVTAGADGVAIVWDVVRRNALQRLEGHTEPIHQVFVARGGERVLTASYDSTVRVWDPGPGQALAALLSFYDGDWAVVDPAGRFDASDDGDIEGLAWIIDREPYTLSQLRDHYYDPGLLTKVMGQHDDPVRIVPPLSSIAAPARVHLDGPDARGHLDIRVEDRGGGIGSVWMSLNGSDVSAALRDACPALRRGQACTFDLSRLPTWLPGAANQVRVEVGNATDLVSSRGLDAFVDAAGDELRDPPDLWVLAVGTSEFADPRIDLTYAATDALRFGRAMRVAGGRGYGAERTHVRILATGEAEGIDARPSRDALTQAFAWLKQSDPLDTVVVFLAGHGVAVTDPSIGVDDYFYLLPSAASLADVRDPALRALRAWSGQDLSDALSAVPALKRVVILDTCAAGKVDVPLVEPRDLSSDAVRAHARSRERTGAWVLAGAAADQVSFEASRFGQGVLTYSLLEGMRGPALDDANQLFVGAWFHYAEDRVPIYASGIGGVQKPITRRGSSDDFPVGELDPDDRAEVELQPLRPVLVRASVHGFGGRQDRCKLSEPLNRALRDEAARGDASFVKWETEVADDTWQVTGQCDVTGETLRFEGFVTWNGDGDVVEHPIEAEGPSAEVVVTEIGRQVAAAVRP